MDNVCPIFVLGSPRSGTTLIGNYIGGGLSVCNLIEYSAFYTSYYTIPNEFATVPTPFKEKYINEIQEHSKKFAEKIAIEQKCKYYCDSTPWNLLIIDKLIKEFPNAIFVLMLRHYSGVIQSLERSYSSGYIWAGDSWSTRAELWSNFYIKTRILPRDRTIAISYDDLCKNPKESILNLKSKLSEFGVNISELDETQLCVSHAASQNSARPVIAKKLENGTIEFTSIQSYNSQKWNTDIDDEISSKIELTDRLLRRLYPHNYTKPKDFI